MSSKHHWSGLAFTLLLLFMVGGCGKPQKLYDPDYVFVREYYFEGSMPRNVLESYLSRAVTHVGLCSSVPEPPTQCFEDDLRMLMNIGAKFIGRAAYAWWPPTDDDFHFEMARERAAKVHEADPEIILQACVFECVSPDVEKIPIPAWVFEEFGLEVEERNFNYEAMLYDDRRYFNQWGNRGSVPDMSKLETKMWFFYRAARYIDAGFEAIHFGQVHLMDKKDPQHRHWFDLLERVRAYAKEHARRKMVLCDAHTHGVVEKEKLLFDFHSFPLRPKDLVGTDQKAILEVGYLSSIFRKSRGGITPSGWKTNSLPYLVEFDNCGTSATPGQLSQNEIWVWGYDEITWFSLQDENYRNEWLEYAWNWVRENDPNGWVQFPTRRNLAVPVQLSLPGNSTMTLNVTMYHANVQSRDCRGGFNQEPVIKKIWENSP